MLMAHSIGNYTLLGSLLDDSVGAHLSQLSSATTRFWALRWMTL